MMQEQEPKFTEEEASEIIMRAVELQSELSLSTNERSAGVSKSELMRVATELGISDTAIQRAMTELSKRPSKTSTDESKLITTLQLTFDRELSDDDLAIVAEELVPLQSFGASPLVIGNSMQYRSLITSGLTNCVLTVFVSRKKGQTELRIRADRSMEYVPVAGLSALSLFSALIGFFEISGNGLLAFLLVLLMPTTLITIGLSWTRRIRTRLDSYLQGKLIAIGSRLESE